MRGRATKATGAIFCAASTTACERDPQIEPITISEAIARQKPESFGKLRGLVPGSWINANFNVWIGAPEDNKAWDYLSQAREFYDDNASRAREEQRKLAYEELLIAEGSDWNWWYGPEHHSANDRDFDELYRKHLSNVYTALGGVPPDHLARPISGALVRAIFVPQTAYVRPAIDGQVSSYFAWMGAAMFSSDRRGGSMHGKLFVLEAIYAGIDEAHLYARLDFAAQLPEGETMVTLHLALRDGEQAVANFRLDVEVAQGRDDRLEAAQTTARLRLRPQSEPHGRRDRAGKNSGDEAADGAAGRRTGTHLQPSLRALPGSSAD